MTISLGGAPGPRNGGMTPMGGRPVQAPPAEEAPTSGAGDGPRRRKPPEMTRARAEGQARAEDARAESVGREGNALDDPGARARAAGGRAARWPRPARAAWGSGLTTGGGGTGGYLDVGNFCCPEYLTTMLQLIQRNWNGQQQVAGQTIMKFTIQRDGRLADVQVEQSSGYQALDLTRAARAARHAAAAAAAGAVH